MVVRRLCLLLLLVLGLGLVNVADADPARAACADSPSLVDDLRRADAVFVGKVTSVGSSNRTAVMEVVEIWKGPDLGATVRVNGGDPDAGSGSDDRTYEAGRTYLVVPSNEAPPFQDSLCSATMLYRPTGSIPAEYVSALGAANVRYTAEAEAERSAATTLESIANFVDSPAVWGTAIGVFVVVIGIVLYRGGAKRRKEKEAAARRPKKRFNLSGVFSPSGDKHLRKLRSKAK